MKKFLAVALVCLVSATICTAFGFGGESLRGGPEGDSVYDPFPTKSPHFPKGSEKALNAGLVRNLVPFSKPEAHLEILDQPLSLEKSTN